MKGGEGGITCANPEGAMCKHTYGEIGEECHCVLCEVLRCRYR